MVRQRLEPSLVNWFVTTSAPAVRTFPNSQQSLVDVGNHLRLSFAEFQTKLANHIAQRKVGALFGAIAGHIDRVRLFVAYLPRMPPQVAQ